MVKMCGAGVRVQDSVTRKSRERRSASYSSFKEKDSDLEIPTKSYPILPESKHCFLYKANALKIEESLASIVGNQIHSYRPIFDQMHRKNEDYKFSKTVLTNHSNKEYEKIVPHLRRFTA